MDHTCQAAGLLPSLESTSSTSGSLSSGCRSADVEETCHRLEWEDAAPASVLIGNSSTIPWGAALQQSYQKSQGIASAGAHSLKHLHDEHMSHVAMSSKLGIWRIEENLFAQADQDCKIFLGSMHDLHGMHVDLGAKF